MGLELMNIIKQQSSMNGIRFEVQKLIQQINELLLHPKLPLTQHLYDINYYSFSQKVLHPVTMLIQIIELDPNLKLQLQKLIKIIKQAAKSRPNEESEDEEVQIPQGDQITAFLSNHKRILETKVDQPGRVELYKFLASREQKEKDNSTFLQSINKIKTNKTQEKDKKMKTIVSQTQTEISWLNHLDIKCELSQFQRNQLKKQFQKYADNNSYGQISVQADQRKKQNMKEQETLTKSKPKSKVVIEKSMDLKKSHISINSFKKSEQAAEDSSDIQDTSLMSTKKSIPSKKSTSKAKIIKPISKIKRPIHDEQVPNKAPSSNSMMKQEIKIKSNKITESLLTQQSYFENIQVLTQTQQHSWNGSQKQSQIQKQVVLNSTNNQIKIAPKKQWQSKAKAQQNKQYVESKKHKQTQRIEVANSQQKSTHKTSAIYGKSANNQFNDIQEKQQINQFIGSPPSHNYSQLNTKQTEASETNPKKQLKLRSKGSLPLLKKSTAKMGKVDYQPQSEIIYQDQAECSLESMDDCKARLTDKSPIEHSHFKYENENKQRSNTFDKLSPIAYRNSANKLEQNLSNKAREKQNLPTISCLGSDQKKDQNHSPVVIKNREKLKVLSNSYHTNSNRNADIVRINKSYHQQFDNGKNSIRNLKKRLHEMMSKSSMIDAQELADDDEKVMEALASFKMKCIHRDNSKQYLNQHQLRQIEQCTKMMETVHLSFCGRGCKHLQRFYSFLRVARSTAKKQLKVVNYLIDSQMIQ